jgi:hydrogenase nickel incorporation protein HypA/HybF
MHELAICQSLLREVERVAATHGARDVARIVVAIGPLSNVEAPLLARAFGVARGGTIAEHAELGFEITSVRVWCEACAILSEVPASALLCGKCGDWRIDVRSGDELLLMRVELAVVAALSDAATG